MRTQPRPAHFLRPGIIGQSRCGRCVRAGRRVPGTVLYLSLQRQHGAVDPWLQHRLWAATFAGYLLAARAIHAGLAAEFRKLANALHRGSVLHHFPDTFLKAPIVRNERPPFSRFAYVSLCAGLLILTACGGGGSAGYPRPGSAPATALTVSDPNAFLLFPNPQLQSDGSKQTDTDAYTQAYYAAIDPTSARDTLNKWKAANGFDSGTGTQVTVVFGDRRDLGYGRRMTARQNTDGTIAFYVENYLVQAGAAYAYSPLNLDAAVVRDTPWLLGINALEYSPGPAGGASFTKIFQFKATTGQRATAVDLHRPRDKAMPGSCITVHGRRWRAPTPPHSLRQP